MRPTQAQAGQNPSMEGEKHALNPIQGQEGI